MNQKQTKGQKIRYVKLVNKTDVEVRRLLKQLIKVQNIIKEQQKELKLKDETIKQYQLFIQEHLLPLPQENQLIMNLEKKII